jgi:hypothetical protein
MIASSLGIYASVNYIKNVLTVGEPATSVSLSEPFYIEHLITDSAFKSWFITNPSISYTEGYIAGAADFNILAQDPGRNIY